MLKRKGKRSVTSKRETETSKSQGKRTGARSDTTKNKLSGIMLDEESTLILDGLNPSVHDSVLSTMKKLKELGTKSSSKNTQKPTRLTQTEVEAIHSLRNSGVKRKYIVRLVGCTLPQYKGIVSNGNYLHPAINKPNLNYYRC